MVIFNVPGATLEATNGPLASASWIRRLRFFSLPHHVPRIVVLTLRSQVFHSSSFTLASLLSGGFPPPGYITQGEK